MNHLRSIQLRPSNNQNQEYPFNLEIIRHLEEMAFAATVTFFVGENGSGKSTLLESIAVAANSITVGSSDLAQDTSLNSIKRLARELKLIWNQKTHKGFFLRAEDFFGYTRRLARQREEISEDMKEVGRQFAHKSSLSLNLAKQPHQRDLNELNQRYGDRLVAASHGESFLNFFQTRFVPGGLYLLDEPEAALSPVSQLAFILLLMQIQDQNAQFIIATHSPILMAYPNATIYDFDKLPVAPVPYDQVGHVQIMKAFMDNPSSFLNHL